MRLAPVLITLVSLAGSASAQPVTAPAACDVKIVRAPDDVRAVIESWVKAEPRCAVRLEVRVVPTQGGGLYLLVRDEHGRERERVVPDAQSAGVLVASWAADDSIIPDAPAGPAPAPAFGPELPPAASAPPSDAPTPAAAPVRIAAAPGLTPPAIAPAGITAVAAPAPSKRWLTMGVMGGMGSHDPFGIRAELDLRTRGNWVFAVGASLQHAQIGLYDGSGAGAVDTTDLRAIASVAWTKQRGRWQLRLGAGAGLMVTTAEGEFAGDPIQANGASPTLELSALLSRELTARWALAAGLVITATHQEYVIPSSDSMLVLTRGTETHAFGGLRRRF